MDTQDVWKSDEPSKTSDPFGLFCFHESVEHPGLMWMKYRGHASSEPEATDLVEQFSKVDDYHTTYIIPTGQWIKLMTKNAEIKYTDDFQKQIQEGITKNLVDKKKAYNSEQKKRQQLEFEWRKPLEDNPLQLCNSMEQNTKEMEFNLIKQIETLFSSNVTDVALSFQQMEAYYSKLARPTIDLFLPELKERFETDLTVDSLTLSETTSVPTSNVACGYEINVSHPPPMKKNMTVSVTQHEKELFVEIRNGVGHVWTTFKIHLQ